MKIKRISAFLLTLAMLLCALPTSAFAAFERPDTTEVEAALTDGNEEIVFDTDFEGAVLTPAGSTGTQNTTSTLSGITKTTGKYFSAMTIRDFWVNDGYRNLYTDGHSIIWRAHDKAFTSPSTGNDDNNNFELTLKSQPAGEDFVISFDVTMLADRFTSAFNCVAYCNNATSQIKSTFLSFAKDGSVKAGTNTVTTLTKGQSASFSVHVKIDEPDAAIEGDKGAVLYDVYLDGKLVKEDLYFVSEADQTRISKVDRNNSAASSPENNTGLSTDYKLTYIRLLHTGGTIRAADSKGTSLGANGADLISLDAVRMYYSDVCYETMSTVEKVSLGYNDSDFDLTFRAELDDAFVNDSGAKIRFTSPSGKVTEIPVPTVGENGKYDFSFALSANDYAGEFTLELIASDGSVYNIYENGKPVKSYKTSVKAIEAELYNFSAAIMPVYGAKKAIVSLTFDDAVYPSALVVEELCEKYGMKASMMMWCSRIGASGSDYADAETWAKLFAKGYLEPQSHSMTHMDLRSNTDNGIANQSEENYKKEIVDSKALLEELFPEYDFLTYAIPFGSMSADAAAIAVKTYYASRGVSSGAVQSLNPGFGTGNGTWGKLYSPTVVKKDADGNVVSEAEQLAYLKSWVDRTVTESGWYVPFIHKVGDVSGTEMTYSVIDELFAYIDKYQDAGDVWVSTFSDAVKYVRERQNTEVAVRYEAGNVYLTLTMADMTEDGLALPRDVFNHPLTVKVEVPESYDTVHYFLDGKLMTANTFTENDVTYAYVDAIPDGEEIVLHGTHSFSDVEKIGEDTHKKICACGFEVTEEHSDSGYGYCTVCELALEGLSLAIDSDLAMRFYVDVKDPAIADGKDISMRFTMNGETFTVTEYLTDHEMYVFTFDGIGPHQVGLTIDAEILIDGEVAVKKTGYSVENYCRDALKLFPDSEPLVSLVNDLLIYARAAEKYLSGKNTIAADMDLTASEYAPAESDDELIIDGNDSEKLFVYSAGVRFDTVNRIFFKIYSETENFSVDLYDAKTSSVITLTAEDLEYTGGYYVAYSAPVYATDFGTDGLQCLTLKDADGNATSVVVYTVNTYAYYMSADGADEDMAALALALYRYGKSAAAYVASAV